MKHLFILLFGVLFLFSCGEDGIEQNNLRDDNVKHKTATDISSYYVGDIINGDLKLGVNESELLKNWNLSLSKSGLNANLTTTELFKFDGRYYISARGGTYKSTRELELNMDNGALYFHPSGITCTTTDCASTPDCIPRGHICTPCPGKGKCRKTATSDEISPD